MDYLRWLFWSLILSYKTKKLSGWNICSFCPNWFYGLNLGSYYWYLYNGFSNGAELVAMAMTGTAAIFLSLSFYALYSQKDFQLSVWLFDCRHCGCIFGRYCCILFPDTNLSVDSVHSIYFVDECLILFETSNIIRGGETNYIMATVTLYISIYNLFLSLIHLLGIFSGDD